MKEERQEQRLVTIFKKVPNPRTGNAERHKLVDILVIALCAMISGADEWPDIAEWGKMHEEWLKKFLVLKGGIPSESTFRRVFRLLNAAAYEKSLLEWVGEMTGSLQGKHISVDGKEMRRSHDHYKGSEALATVSVWLREYGLTLGQIKSGMLGEEIRSVQDILEMLELKGCIVTADALHCQTETAKLIIDKGGDYILPVKGNQKNLHTALEETFNYEIEHQFAGIKHTAFEQTNKGHGRIETRRCAVIHDLSYIQEVNSAESWPRMQSLIRLERIRRTGPDFNTITRHVTYAISSLAVPAKTIAAFIRQHWSIENALHWRLDVIFREDLSRVRSGFGQENLATLRRFALNFIQQEKSSKRSVNGKRLKAAWDTDYLEKILFPL